MLQDYLPPEILRTRLEELCLQIKVFIVLDKMGLVTTKPVFGVSEKARLKPVSLAIETS